MATNTVKALTEARAAKVKELREANDKLDAKPGDADLLKRFGEVEGELKAIVEKLERAKRVENMEAETRAAGTLDLTGVEDGDLSEGQKRDNPLYDPDGKGYRVLDVLLAQLEGRTLKGVAAEVQSELEAIANKAGRKSRGLLLPMNLRCDMASVRRGAAIAGASGVDTRNHTTTTGAGAIVNNVAPTLIQLLRRRTVCERLGAVIMSDMTGTFAIPKETGENTFEWVAEGGAATKSQGSIGQVTFGPKTLTAWTGLTRRFMKQASIDAEMFARYQLIEGAARGLDFGGLAGPGTANNVLGVTIDTDVPLVLMGANGAQLNWAKVVEFETRVRTNNADFETMAYVMNAVTNGSTKTLPKISGFPQFLQENREMNGYTIAVTNQLPANLTKGTSVGVCSSMVFGDFSKMVFALWGALDILVDPYSESTTGTVRVTAHQDADVYRIYDEAFSRCLDVLQ
jgi:HK97 family phage major capsid protein